MKVREVDSYIFVASRVVSLGCFFLFSSVFTSYFFTHLLLIQSGIKGLGVNPIREDLGFILCLCSPLVICIKFTLGHML